MTPRYPTTDIAQNLPKLPTHPWCQAIASISQFFLLGVLPPPQDLCVFTQVLQLQVSVLFFFFQAALPDSPQNLCWFRFQAHHPASVTARVLCVDGILIQDSGVCKGRTVANLDHGLQHRAKSSPRGGYRMLLWHWVFIRGDVLVHLGCYHKHTGQFIGNKKNAFLAVLNAVKSKIKSLAELMSAQGCLSSSKRLQVLVASSVIW